MKFNLKLFVLVGIFVGLCDVWGMENKDDDGFIVDGLKNKEEAKALKVAMDERRVIRAVYKTEKAGDVSIIHETFKDKLSKAFVCAGNGENGVKEVDNFVANSAGRLVHNMQEKVEYTVYFIFNNESFNSKSEGLLVSTALMFDWCTSLIHADLSNFNTTNVKKMYEMFYNCTALTELNLSKFDTTKVTDMYSMFYRCSSLTELNLSSFDTQNVTDMSAMFCDCSSLTRLDLSSFVTTSVTNMSKMFSDCTALTELDLSKFDTQNVTTMSDMFYNCSSLTKLNLSKFNTTKVTDMSCMFSDCTALTELDLSKFDFSKVGDMDEMFLNCKIKNLSLPKKYKDIRKRCICCGYVYLKGERVEGLSPNNVVFVEGE